MRKPTFDANFDKKTETEAPEASICENVIRIVATALWEFSVGGQESGSTVNYIGKRPQQQRGRFAGLWFYCVNIAFLRKLHILA